MTGNLYDLLAGGFPTDRGKPAFLLERWVGRQLRPLEAGVGRRRGPLDRRGRPARRPGRPAGREVVDAVMIYLGVLKAGAVFLPLNAAYTPAEVDYFIKDAEPRVSSSTPRAFVARRRGRSRWRRPSAHRRAISPR